MKNLNTHLAIFELLEDSDPVIKVATRLQHLIDYYEEGRDYYQKNISVEDSFDHDETIAFLDVLQTLTGKIINPTGPVTMILTRGTQSLNVLPISSVFEHWTLPQVLSILQSVKSALVLYLHADNCIQFKTAYATLNNWYSFFTQLEP